MCEGLWADWSSLSRVTLPESGETPLCWYATEAFKGAFDFTGNSDDSPDDWYFNVEDW